MFGSPATFHPRRKYERHIFEQLEPKNLLTIVTLEPSQDTSLYEDSQGALSNGAGDFLFIGKTRQAEGESLRRALLRFDLAEIPAGSTISEVTLTLHVSRSISSNEPASLHRLLRLWGEGTSDAAQQEGKGAPSAPGDATWIHTNFPSTDWDAPGGDFVAASSATIDVAGNGSYQWSSPEMIADVERWLADPSENFGWILLGSENSLGSAKRFDSRENPDVANRPELSIEFTEPLPMPTLTVEDASVAEGQDGTTQIEFPVTLSMAPTAEISAEYSIVPGTATADEDYVDVTGVVRFAPGDATSKTIVVEVQGDEVTEADETFTLQLGDVVGADVATEQAVGTITNDDPQPGISLSDKAVNEGSEGPQIVELLAQLSHASDFEITLTYATVPGTATEADFVVETGEIVFLPGETLKTIPVEMNGDLIDEETESFTLQLSDPVNVNLIKSIGLITISDDDEPSEFPWQNQAMALDVYGDGLVTPRDALLIINRINSSGSGPLEAPTLDQGPPPFFDVSGDNQITPRDALLVISHINQPEELAAANVDLAMALLDRDQQPR